MKLTSSISCFKHRAKVGNSAGEDLEPVYLVRDAEVADAAVKLEMPNEV